MNRTVLIAILNVTLFGGGAAQDFEAAARNIRRLNPRDFTGIPGPVRNRFANRGCMIPQSSAEKGPHNLIQGEFAKKGQIDYAMLCSQNGKSSIVVFWGGTTGCKDEDFASNSDKTFLQVTDFSTISYSRVLGVADAAYIQQHAAAYKGPKPPARIDHAGIDDIFVGKASTVYYCDVSTSKWVKLQGAD